MSEEHVADTYVSGLSHIEMIGGGCARFCLYVNQTDGEKVVQRIVARLIMPVDAVPESVRKTMRVIGYDDQNSTLGLIPESLH